MKKIVIDKKTDININKNSNKKMAKKVTKIEEPSVIEKTTTETFEKMNTIVDEALTETPVVEETVDETPVVEEIVDETPEEVDETPEEVDETPVDETPVVETPVVETDETPVEETDESGDENDEISELLKSEHYFNYLSCGRHLQGKYSEENLKEFWIEYKGSNSLSTPNHYRLVYLLNEKFGEEKDVEETE